MAKKFSILCLATGEQQTIHKHMPGLVDRVSDGRAEYVFVEPPHVPTGPLMFGISPHRVPSDVHAVDCGFVAEALAPLDCEYAMLLDGSVYLDEVALITLFQEIEALGDNQGLALPIRYNFCPDGALVPYAADGSARFEYGALPKTVLAAVLSLGPNVYTGDVLLSELALIEGVGLQVSDIHADRFPERILLYRGRASRKAVGLPCPEGICLEDDYHRRFTGQVHDCALVSELRKAMREGEIGLMTGPLDTTLYGRIHDALAELKPELVRELEGESIRDSLPRLMASVEPYMDIFESRLDMLNCIVLLKSEELGETVRLGDREFWSSFSRYTFNDTILMSKLLYLKV